MAEHDVDNPAEEQPELIVKLPVKGEVTRTGSSVYAGSLKAGSISYFFHWTPPAIVATCHIHPNCYTTAPLAGCVSEDDLVDWLGQGPGFKTTRDHEQFIPVGTYNKRIRRQWIQLLL